MSEPALHPPDFTTYNVQSQSLLFSTLPPEIRSEIFTYALAPFEDPSRAYSKETYWRRPGYSAPHRTHPELLRTCKRVYAETWFMPFALAEHTFYLTAQDRAPRNLSHAQFKPCLELIHRLHGGDGSAEIETGNVRVFAQLYILEPGDAFQRLLDTPYFRPRRVRLTIRYTDFWHWENNRLLYVDGTWVGRVRFPESVRSFVVDFESLERRRAEVDIVSGQAVERWMFSRKDGRVLLARKEDMVVSKWTGSSMFGGNRWIRDEVRPGELDYYVVTVTWRVSGFGSNGTLSASDRENHPTVRVPTDFQQPPPPYTGRATIRETNMREAGVTMDMSAGEAMEEQR
ncbi:hypothetical protein BDW62DRAFT_212995 [Aspergillus aurantiobrunneus]